MFSCWLDGRLVSTVVILAIICAPVDGIASVMKQYDSSFLAIFIAAFVIISIFGTRMVLRCDSLPANDELFDFSESTSARQAGGLTPAQRAALRGDHVRESAPAQ
jgi:hypothetical protein